MVKKQGRYFSSFLSPAVFLLPLSPLISPTWPPLLSVSTVPISSSPVDSALRGVEMHRRVSWPSGLVGNINRCSCAGSKSQSAFQTKASLKPLKFLPLRTYLDTCSTAIQIIKPSHFGPSLSLKYLIIIIVLDQTYITYFYIYILYMKVKCLPQVWSGCRVLEPIPAYTGGEVSYTHSDMFNLLHI